MPHYRVTRPEGYGPGTPGYTDLGARQGYYTDADTPNAARAVIDARLRADKWSSYRPGEPLDVQPWGRGTGEPEGPPDLSPLGYNRAHGIPDTAPAPLTYYCDSMRHLVCTPYSTENLHRMAQELGIKRCWFHNSKDHLHYDIPKRRIAEIQARCTVVSPRDILKIIKGTFPA